MKKALVLLVLFLISSACVHAEDIIGPYAEHITKVSNPIYYAYMEDYGMALDQALRKKFIFPHFYWGTSYKYTITRDGKIENLKVDIYQNEYFNKKIKEVILSVKPLPFRNGMNVDKMNFSVFLGYSYHNDIECEIFPLLNYGGPIFDIDVTVR